MRTLRIPVAIAACSFVLFSAATSSADEMKKAPPATNQPTQATPAQPQQPSVIVVTPPAQPPQQQPQVQQPQVQQPRVGTTRTTQAEYTPPRDTYEERTVERRPNSTLLSTGMGLFILSYGPAAVAAATSSREADKRLFIPVAGPWLDLANRDCRGHRCGETEDVAKAMIITSGVVQGAAALMALGSLIIPETTTVSERKAADLKPSVKVLPVSFGAGAGIGAMGRF
jgi:hypothetical protein